VQRRAAGAERFPAAGILSQHTVFCTEMPKLPWTVILSQLPTLMRAVDTFAESTARKNAERDTRPAIESLHKRIASLEDQQRASADLLKQLAEHVNTLAGAVQASSLALRRATVVGGVAAAVSLIALVLAIILWVRG
jgi:hypothetical protein